MSKRFLALGAGVLLAVLVLFPGCSSQQNPPKQEAQASAPRPAREKYERLMPRQAPTSDIVFVGKAFCSLRRSLPLPYPAVITSLDVKSGDDVKKGQPLGRFRLTSETYRELRSRILRGADLGLVSEELGVTVSGGALPRDGVITSPLDGRVLWIHPDFRPNAQLERSQSVFKVGVMDPMVIRAEVYEAEARRLKIGDDVTIRPETVPDWRVRATISQVALSPVSDKTLDPSYYEVECTVDNPDLVLREGMRILVYLFQPPEGK